jgi:3-oxoacyl-[acyl-carrier-protein] synthase-1
MALAGASIIGLGACTPIGRTIWASAAAARAGICGFSEHPFMIDTAGEPMRVARCPWLGTEVVGVERLYRLLFPAIDEALAFARRQLHRHPARLGLALALPPPRPGQPPDLGEQILQAIAHKHSDNFVHTTRFEIGHAAGLVALDATMEAFSWQSIDACVVAGVDSYLAPETLEWIEECDQLHGAGPLNNAWGFIPGEAAGAVLLATSVFAHQISAEILGEVVGIGVSRESNLIKTDDVCIGKGLTHAFRQALLTLAQHEQIHNVFCDLNGEKYRADEYGFSSLRMKDRFCSASDFVAPADCWGDVGAAGSLLHVAMAVVCQLKRYGKGPLSMVWGSSESGERGAAVIRSIEPMVS